MGSSAVPQEVPKPLARGALPKLQIGAISAKANNDGHQSSDDSARSRSNSINASLFTESNSTTASSYTDNDFARMLGGNSHNPKSATSHGSAGGIGMERENSLQGMQLPNLGDLSLELGRPLDVEDLDDSGWKAASKDGRIVELGGLGEGAGGAVTRCILKGGKTVFALKVSTMSSRWKS